MAAPVESSSHTQTPASKTSSAPQVGGTRGRRYSLILPSADEIQQKPILKRFNTESGLKNRLDELRAQETKAREPSPRPELEEVVKEPTPPNSLARERKKKTYVNIRSKKALDTRFQKRSYIRDLQGSCEIGKNSPASTRKPVSTKEMKEEVEGVEEGGGNSYGLLSSLYWLMGW